MWIYHAVTPLHWSTEGALQWTIKLKPTWANKSTEHTDNWMQQSRSNKTPFAHWCSKVHKLCSAILQTSESAQTALADIHSSRMLLCKVAYSTFKLPIITVPLKIYSRTDNSLSVLTFFPPLDTQISPHRKAWIPRWPEESFRKSSNFNKKTKKMKE